MINTDKAKLRNIMIEDQGSFKTAEECKENIRNANDLKELYVLQLLSHNKSTLKAKKSDILKKQTDSLPLNDEDNAYIQLFHDLKKAQCASFIKTAESLNLYAFILAIGLLVGSIVLSGGLVIPAAISIAALVVICTPTLLKIGGEIRSLWLSQNKPFVANADLDKDTSVNSPQFLHDHDHNIRAAKRALNKAESNTPDRVKDSTPVSGPISPALQNPILFSFPSLTDGSAKALPIKTLVPKATLKTPGQ